MLPEEEFEAVKRQEIIKKENNLERKKTQEKSRKADPLLRIRQDFRPDPSFFQGLGR